MKSWNSLTVVRISRLFLLGTEPFPSEGFSFNVLSLLQVRLKWRFRRAFDMGLPFTTVGGDVGN